MKKLLASMVIVLFISSLFAVESDPSTVVGYVEYGLTFNVALEDTDLNFIALPMDAGYTLASGVGTDVGVCDVVSYWDAASQQWSSATDLGFPLGWVGDFAVATGDPLMVNVTADVNFYVAGDLPAAANYSLIFNAALEDTDLNAIMVPLDQTFTLASGVGTDIGVCDVVSYWDAASQQWSSATDLGFPLGWVGDFAVTIADPLMVNVTGAASWPTALLMSNEQAQTKIVNTNLKKNRK